ncbi:rRNA maturation RNase YbeY [Calothrix sp. UHCC 0171]|uniref:rRNA maturation RNase YbeY n=1 Tax=Calothrix sp. UHCC 0171 TaxID=3110245 RepID=UPI002B1F4FD2|nr:rRNA maturation RNase YbeY [Calothrix sp. UHCC 0171]MEA5573248.1 rRNA maturation RNase YbeY [Calothrix sp. UHCC 0171]
MLVELYVQDFFAEASQSEILDTGNTDAMVSPETWNDWFKRWLQELEANLPPAPSYEIGLRLTDDAEIQQLNSQYRHQNQPTDVLAFAALEVDCPQPDELVDADPLYLGDIIVSIDTAKRQAQGQGHTLSNELAWLSAHGLLHLLGWDHPDDESLRRMLEQQVKLLMAIGISIDIL